MPWIHGYLLFCSFWAALMLRDFWPLIPYLYVPVPSAAAWAVLFGYLAAVILLSVVLPGPVYAGAVLADGSRLRYKCNGLAITLVLTALLVAAHINSWVDGTWVADHYDELFVASNVFALALSTLLFVKGRYFRGRVNWISRHENPPSLWHDFVMGTELNPMLFSLDVKFLSYRPAMAGWLLVNLSFLAKHVALHSTVSAPMLLYQAFTGWYCVDYFVNEPKMLHTWDIIAEHFGLMLVWGDYVFIVFAFSIQNFFLLHYDPAQSHSPLVTALNVALFVIGFAIFRGANSQKHRFKENPDALIWGSKPNTIDGKLLCSGYWGIARHLNYTGDCILAFSYCMPCGFSSSLPYLYFIYLLLLTLHREKRDEERCSAKYAQVWEKYCSRVPYRMFPFIY